MAHNLVSKALYLGKLSALNVNVLRRCISNTTCLRDIYKIQDQNDFNEKVLKNKKPIIVDFYATWCGPCKLLAPRLETIIGSKKGEIDLAKVDVDELDTLATDYEVTSLPTVYALKDGKILDKFIGLKDDDQLRAFVGKVLNE